MSNGRENAIPWPDPPSHPAPAWRTHECRYQTDEAIGGYPDAETRLPPLLLQTMRRNPDALACDPPSSPSACRPDNPPRTTADGSTSAEYANHQAKPLQAQA